MRECHGEAMARLDELQRALAPPLSSSSREHDLDDLGRSPKQRRYHHADASDGADDDTQPLGGPSP